MLNAQKKEMISNHDSQVIPGALESSPELEAQAAPLIEECYSHLEEVKIAYLMHHGEWRSNGKRVPFKTTVVSHMWRHLSGYDLVIEINKNIYDSLSEKGRLTLLDNCLCGFQPAVKRNKFGQTVWRKKSPDIIEFSEVVNRRRIYMSSSIDNIIENQETKKIVYGETLRDNVVNDQKSL